MLQHVRRNWFLYGLVGVLLAGFSLPGAGDTLNPGGVTQSAIVLVFFLMTGFTLPSELIQRGLNNVRLHVAVQLLIFGFIPLYFALFTPLFAGYLGGNLPVGFYALAVLPTTISSSTILTQTSGGNTVGTMFNSALANTIGILVSPLLLSIFLSAGTAGLPPNEIVGVLRDLALIMVLPVAVGQLLRRRARELADRVKKRVSSVSSALILTIVFLTISSTASDPDFLRRVAELPIPFLFLAVSHLVFVAMSVVVGRSLGLPRADRVSMLFCAPQKTMAMGVPLLTVYFGSRPDVLGFALLPLLFYHPFQIFTGGVLRGLLARRAASGSPS